MEKFYEVLENPLFANIKVAEYKVLMTCINGNIRKFSSDDYIFLAGSEISYVGDCAHRRD